MMVAAYAEVTIDYDVFTDVIAFGGELSQKFATIAEREVGVPISAALEREFFSLKPGPPKYPIQWTSERQRKAFFATRGFGRGIPTRRTGRINEGWRTEVTATADGGLIEIYNTEPSTPFVWGFPGFEGWQQRFHIATGWPTLSDTVRVLSDMQATADVLLEDAWHDYFQAELGV